MIDIPEKIRYTKKYLDFYNLILINRLINIFDCSLTEAILCVSQNIKHLGISSFLKKVKKYSKHEFDYDFIVKNHIYKLHTKHILIPFKRNREYYKNIVEKFQDTMMKKYGYISNFSRKEVKEKRNKTMMDKYDTIYPLQSSTCLLKFQKTVKEINNISDTEMERRLREDLNKIFFIKNFVKNNLFYINNAMDYFNYAYSRICQLKNKFNIYEKNYTNNIKIEQIFIHDLKEKFKIIIIQQFRIDFNNTFFKVDGYDKDSNTIYEFLGDYFHGNLEKFNPLSKTYYGKTMEYLNEKTFDRLNIIKSLGYNVKYVWESDYLKNGLESIKTL